MNAFFLVFLSVLNKILKRISVPLSLFFYFTRWFLVLNFSMFCHYVFQESTAWILMLWKHLRTPWWVFVVKWKSTELAIEYRRFEPVAESTVNAKGSKTVSWNRIKLWSDVVNRIKGNSVWQFFEVNLTYIEPRTRLCTLNVRFMYTAYENVTYIAYIGDQFKLTNVHYINQFTLWEASIRIILVRSSSLSNHSSALTVPSSHQLFIPSSHSPKHEVSFVFPITHTYSVGESYGRSFITFQVPTFCRLKKSG